MKQINKYYEMLSLREQKILEILRIKYYRGGVDSAEAKEIAKHLVWNDLQLLNGILEIWEKEREEE